MVLKNITISYGSCTYCGRSSSIVSYTPGTVYSLPDLERLIRRECNTCNHALSIKKVKMKGCMGGVK